MEMSSDVVSLSLEMAFALQALKDAEFRRHFGNEGKWPIVMEE